MKRILLIAFLSFVTFNGFSQSGHKRRDTEDRYWNIDYINQPTIIGLYGGFGCATVNNYNVALSGGLSFEKTSKGNKFRIGANLFYQQFSLYSDDEANSAKNGTGTAGEIWRHQSGYVFIAPCFSYQFINRVNFISDINLNVGVGFKISGYDSVHKWNNGYFTNGYYTNYAAGIGQYDSVIDASKNINSMLIRVGMGVTQYCHMGGKGNFWFTIKEDFGFIANDLTKTGQINNESPSRTQYSPTNQKPAYISLYIGISYIKTKKVKY